MVIAPTSTAFQRPDLGAAYYEFEMEAANMGYIAAQVLPVFSSAVKNGNFSVIPLEELIKDVNTTRAPGAGYARDDMKFEQQSFFCQEYGAEEPVDDASAALYRYSFDAEMIASQRVVGKLLRNMEIAAAAAVFNTTTWTGSTLTTGVAVQWSTPATATPVTDVINAIQKVRATCGMKPNVVIMSYNVFLFLQTCVQVKDQLRFAGIEDPKQATEAQLAALFHVDKVIVAHRMRNTANSGNGTPVISEIWSDDMVMVAKVATGMDLAEPCIGRTFTFSGDGASENVLIEQYREEQRRSDIIRGRMDWDQLIIQPGCGHLLTGINS